MAACYHKLPAGYPEVNFLPNCFPREHTDFALALYRTDLYKLYPSHSVSSINGCSLEGGIPGQLRVGRWGPENGSAGAAPRKSGDSALAAPACPFGWSALGRTDCLFTPRSRQ